MKILHTESSEDWEGQELRILRESEGMRQRGHQVVLAVQEGKSLAAMARASGFKVVELPFNRAHAIPVFYRLLRLIRQEKIDIVNTHSSFDAWIGGLVGKLSGCRVVRTRHLSTPVRKGVNSRVLYNWLADYVVTTCEETAETLRLQAQLPSKRCLSIPTGTDPSQIHYEKDEVLAFRRQIGVAPEDCLVGTLCVLRSWKGISDLLQAAKLLEDVPHLKWVVVGSGVSESFFLKEWKALGLEKKVVFAGHIFPPYAALAAMDIFLLLSTGSEGVSQASLQAAWLEKPLITTSVGGLKEVCIDQRTGFQVPKKDPHTAAHAVMRLVNDPDLRKQMGREAKKLISSTFLFSHILDQMERVLNE